MPFRILASLLFSFTLIGCGSDSSNNYEIYDTWESESKFFDYQEGLLTVYTFNEPHFCYLVDYSIIEKISSSHYTALVSSGFSLESQWNVTKDTLVLEGELSGNIQLDRSNQDSDLLDTCTSASHPGDINISITFQNLPSVIQVNHEFTLDDYVEYNVEIKFDLNNNNQKDAGDLTFRLNNVKRDSHPESELNLNYLEASFGQLTKVDENGNSWAESIGDVAYSINNNTIDIAIYKLNQQSLPMTTEFPTIPENVGINISTQYINRSGIRQQDDFPDSYYSDNNYTSGLDLSYMQDNSDDVSVYSGTVDDIIVDIEEISITFTD